jgi:hypothetical protein
MNAIRRIRPRLPSRLRHDGWWLAERRPPRGLLLWHGPVAEPASAVILPFAPPWRRLGRAGETWL